MQEEGCAQKATLPPWLSPCRGKSTSASLNRWRPEGRCERYNQHNAESLDSQGAAGLYENVQFGRNRPRRYRLAIQVIDAETSACGLKTILRLPNQHQAPWL